MSETPSSQPRTTPARRRHGRGNGRAGAHKAYASENDASNVEASRYDQTPQTPQKPGATDSPGPQSTQPGSKPRNRNANNNKPKSKNTPNSPESTRPGRHTPPHTTASMKSVNAPAFAGATFHASPAPSALPLPSFVAKPVVESPSIKATGRDIVQEPSPPTDHDAPTPSHAAAKRNNQESPLDFMFRAHREEKERQRYNSPTSARPVSAAVGESPSRSPFNQLNHNGLSNTSGPPQAARSMPKFPSSGIDAAELDGTPGRPMGPAFSTPYQERIKAARTNPGRPPVDQQSPQFNMSPESQDPTEALKKFLFNGALASGPNGSPNGALNGHSSSPRSSHPLATEAYAPPASANPPTNNERTSGRTNNIQAMEDDLRRILKLDLAAGSTNTERRLFS